MVVDEAVSATCTTEGKTEGSHCSVCGVVIVAQQVIPKVDHKVVVDSAVTATTTADGKTAGSHCSVCNTVIKAQSVIAYPKTITLSKTKYTYNGKVQKPTVTVKDANGTVIAAENYTVTYAKGCKNKGTYKVTIAFTGNYSGTVEKTFAINKAPNTMTVKPAKKTVKYAQVKKKAQKVKLTVAKNNGKVTYKTSSKNLTVKKGVVTIKKGTKKGTYTVKVSAKGDANHNAITKTVKITIK